VESIPFDDELAHLGLADPDPRFIGLLVRRAFDLDASLGSSPVNQPITGPGSSGGAGARLFCVMWQNIPAGWWLTCSLRPVVATRTYAVILFGPSKLGTAGGLQWLLHDANSWPGSSAQRCDTAVSTNRLYGFKRGLAELGWNTVTSSRSSGPRMIGAPAFRFRVVLAVIADECLEPCWPLKEGVRRRWRRGEN
jgi:hypothetical protein